MAEKKRDDFVRVRLTKKGCELAGDGAIVIQEGHHEFTLKPGAEIEVTRAFDWSILARQQRDGEPLFEIAATPATAAVNKEKTSAVKES